jgi:hypothetical protein
MAVIKKKFSVMTAMVRGGWNLFTKLHPSTPLTLFHDYKNANDPNAVMVCRTLESGKLQPLGYLPPGLAHEVAPLLEIGVVFECRRVVDVRMKGIAILAYDDQDKGTKHGAPSDAEPKR